MQCLVKLAWSGHPAAWAVPQGLGNMVPQAPSGGADGNSFEMQSHEAQRQACEALQANLKEEFRAVLSFDTAFQQARACMPGTCHPSSLLSVFRAWPACWRMQHHACGSGNMCTHGARQVISPLQQARMQLAAFPYACNFLAMCSIISEGSEVLGCAPAPQGQPDYAALASGLPAMSPFLALLQRPIPIG